MIEGHGMDSLAFRFRLGRVFVLAVALLLLVSNGWAACTWVSTSPSGCATACAGGSPDCSQCHPAYVNNCNNVASTVSCPSGYPHPVGGGGMTCNGTAISYVLYCCGTQCEAEQKECEDDGGTWIPSDDPNECGECQKCDEDEETCVADGGIWVPGSDGECGYCDSDTTDVCAEFRRQCTGAGGDFSGSEYNTSTGKCCSATCNLCNNESAEKIRSQKTKECCAQNMAPPDPLQQCYTPLESGCGMTSSRYSDNDNDWACKDPNQSTEAFNSFYRECGSSSSNEDGSSSSDCEGEGCEDPGPHSSNSQSSSSNEEGPNSSEDVGPNSSTDGSGCEECQLLEEAIDTLHLIHLSIDGIYTCLSSPYVCTSNKVDDSNDPFQFDTAFRRYLRPLMDSMLKVDSNQLKALVRLDTNTLKMLRNDTTTRTVIEGGFSSLEDTTRKWFKRIADSIGVSTSELAAHIDSIIRHIPDSVLDSIVKYQQYATDNFDSVLYGHGKGFSLVDSLIDSAVRYFQLSHHYDSMYNLMFRDSLGSINQSVDRVPIATAGAVNSVFGYGDTASSTLRGDLEGIRGAIEGLGDTSGLGGHGGGYGDSLGRYRDSINKYYITDGRFGELVDSTETAWGVDSLDARWDSSFDYGQCDGDDCPPCSDDSCMGSLSGNFLQRADSIARIAGDSLEASTKRQRDSLPTFWDTTFNELRQYSWFGSFDSTFLANIGAKIPNSNTCPEHCFAQDVNGTYAYVAYNMHLDWKLCRPIAPNVLNSLNAFDILKLLARILTVVTCLSILMWEVSSRRGGGIGL